MAFTRNQIRQEFRCRPKLYMCPLGRKRQRVMAKDEPAGDVKEFTEEEIFLYKMRQFVKLLNDLGGKDALQNY